MPNDSPADLDLAVTVIHEWLRRIGVDPGIVALTIHVAGAEDALKVAAAAASNGDYIPEVGEHAAVPTRVHGTQVAVLPGDGMLDSWEYGTEPRYLPTFLAEWKFLDGSVMVGFNRRAVRPPVRHEKQPIGSPDDAAVMIEDAIAWRRTRQPPR